MSANHHDTGVDAAPAADPDATITGPGYCSYGYYHNHARLRPDNSSPPHTPTDQGPADRGPTDQGPADQGPSDHTYSHEAISAAARYVLEEYRGVDIDEDVLVGLVQQRLRESTVTCAHGHGYRTRVKVSWTGTGTGTGEVTGKGKDVVVETRLWRRGR